MSDYELREIKYAINNLTKETKDKTAPAGCFRELVFMLIFIWICLNWQPLIDFLNRVLAWTP